MARRPYRLFFPNDEYDDVERDLKMLYLLKSNNAITTEGCLARNVNWESVLNLLKQNGVIDPDGTFDFTHSMADKRNARFKLRRRLKRLNPYRRNEPYNYFGAHRIARLDRYKRMEIVFQSYFRPFPLIPRIISDVNDEKEEDIGNNNNNFIARQRRRRRNEAFSSYDDASNGMNNEINEIHSILRNRIIVMEQQNDQRFNGLMELLDGLGHSLVQISDGLAVLTQQLIDTEMHRLSASFNRNAGGQNNVDNDGDNQNDNM